MGNSAPGRQALGRRSSRFAGSPMTNSLAHAVLDALRSDDCALNELRALVSVQAPPPPESDAWMTAREAAAYLGMTRNALYKLSSADLVPVEREGVGCKLWFRRSALDAWREAGGARSRAWYRG